MLVQFCTSITNSDMDYKILTLIKKRDNVVAEIEYSCCGVMKYGYSRDLSAEELTEAVEADAQGHLADEALWKMNAERDAKEKADSEKVELAKKELGVE